jgi:glucan phosphoethanolaminetransferase (alkaline phosphatase superfamily)
MSDTKDTENGIFGSHKISLILLLVFVIFIYIIMFSILHKNNETPSGWIIVIEIILWVTLIIIIIEIFII